MKTYIITLAKVFQKPHSRTGEPTGFKDKFLSGQKIHTIRGNYPLWAKRITAAQDASIKESEQYKELGKRSTAAGMFYSEYIKLKNKENENH